MTPQIVLTLIIIGVAVVLFATETLRVDVIALLVLLVLVLTGLVDSQEAFAGFASPAVITVWAVYIVSGGLFRTGVADIIGRRIIRLAGLITQPMSNAVATVLIVPIAIDTALELGANPQSFVLATVIGASTSFLTPVGHQANVLIFGPGGYRFADYTRVGGLLNIVLLIATLVFLPILWPLFE